MDKDNRKHGKNKSLQKGHKKLQHIDEQGEADRWYRHEITVKDEY